jgi:hypothetical protein
MKVLVVGAGGRGTAFAAIASPQTTGLWLYISHNSQWDGSNSPPLELAIYTE